MPRQDKFLIAPLNSGVHDNVKPWLIPDDAFQLLRNAYVFRGRVRKRFGARLMKSTTTPTDGYESLVSRLRIRVATTDGAGAASGTVPGSKFQVGQMFSIGDQIYTVNAAGVPANMLNTGAGTGTYNTTTGAYVFAGAAATTAVYFYPADPVMGLVNYEQTAINREQLIGFDTQFAYQFTSAGWIRLGDAVWTGSNSDYFWATNWLGDERDEIYLFVTNYTDTDRIKYWDGANWTQNTAGTQVGFSPVLDNLSRLHSARIILPFHDRLIALNTLENVEGTSVGTTTAATGNFSGVVGAGPWSLGQNFLIGNFLFTIASTAAGAQAMTVTGLLGIATPPTATFDVTTGTLTVTGNGNNGDTTIYFLSNSGGTQERFTNRCRYSWNGVPVAQQGTDPNSAQAWLDLPGFGSYLDASTNEAIITAQFLYDRLIVYFERSTWELVYTGNEIAPFRWQKINTELGAESTFSQVSFDKVVLGIGNVGIHACNGSNVDRIDNNIPDLVFELHNLNNGLERVNGIRDYFAEMVYWAIPTFTRDTAKPFNNKVLTYNYKTGSWGINDDSITCFGFYQPSTSVAQVWQDIKRTWAESQYPWASPSLQGEFRNVVAGNQEGYVFIVDTDKSTNCSALQITDIDIGATEVSITCYNHNLDVGLDGEGDYIYIESVQGVNGLNEKVFAVEDVIDENTFTIVPEDISTVTGTYTGGGVIERVSAMNIITKQYNFYTAQGRNSSINKVDFLVDKTSNGQVTVDFFASSSNLSLRGFGIQNGSIIGNSKLDTSPYSYSEIENYQERLWHPVYPMVNGECIQFRIYLDDDQLKNYAISSSDFTLHAMTFYTRATGERLQ